VPGAGSGADGAGRRALLALRLLAALPMGELAAAGGPKLSPVRQSALLVAQPKKRQL
jgi:hypothetical protein